MGEGRLMTINEIYQMICQVISSDKVAYWTFPEKQAPELPYIIYFEDSSDNFSADNQVYVPISRFYVELYTHIESGRNFTLENQIETKLNQNSIVWSKEYTILDSENMIEVIYEMEVNK